VVGYVILNDHPHRRFNPLRQEWVLVSPYRTTRPWQGQIEPPPSEATVAFDPACYLCPGNERANGARNPLYTSTFAFENDFAALRPTTPKIDLGGNEVGAELARPGAIHDDIRDAGELLAGCTERGVCRVLCFSPRHDLTLARMDVTAIRAVVDAWIEQQLSLAAAAWIEYVQLFENRGAMMGASNPHPHGQIWATETVPNEPAREHASFAAYHERTGTCLLCEYSALESRLNERVVVGNDAFLAIVPFWAAWPFEVLLVSRRHCESIDDLDDQERDGLADIVKRLTIRYDNLFEAPFPYTMGFHQRPVRGSGVELCHLHGHFYPPLLRSASIRKFMVGFELLASPQRDFAPEEAAARLREANELHYSARPAQHIARHD
jgi:UDPglucose--hexose-1-phosphate uridylyltransferase